MNIEFEVPEFKTNKDKIRYRLLLTNMGYNVIDINRLVPMVYSKKGYLGKLRSVASRHKESER